MWPAVQHTLGSNQWLGVKVRRTESMAVGGSGNTIINWTDPVFDTDDFWSGTDRTFNTNASINSSTDVITLDSAHGWTTGQAVWYQRRLQPNNAYQTAVSKTSSLKFYVPGTEGNSNAYERVRNIANNAPTAITFGYPDGLSSLGYRAIRFTATNSGTSWTKDPTNLRDDFTLECWFNSTATLATSTNFYHPAALMMSDISGVTNDYGLGIGGAMKPVFGTGNPDQFITASGTYNDGNWHHVVATRTKATGAVEIWVDGVSRATGTMSNTGSLPAESIYWTGMNYSSFVGGVAHLAAYNAVLNSTTIGQHYTLGSAGARSPEIGLTNNTLYYVRSIAANQVALYTSAVNATNDTSRINLTAGGNETHYLSVDPSRITAKKAGLYHMNLTAQTTGTRLGGMVIERYNSANTYLQGHTVYVNETSSSVPRFLNNHASFKMDAGDYIKCWARAYTSGTMDVIDDTPAFWMYRVG